MADGRYSIDDILIEYSKTDNADNTVKPDNGIDLDELLKSYDIKPGNTATDTLYDELHGIKEALNKPEYEDSLAEKKTVLPERSFSDKYEDENAYDEADGSVNTDTKKSGLFSGRSKKEGRQMSPLGGELKREAAVPGNKTERKTKDPFEEYSASSGNQSRRSLDDILDEYSGSIEKKHAQNRMQNTSHKGFTDFFTRLLSKAEAGDEPVKTELLDGMMKIKKEQAEYTGHITRMSRIPPIERKSISDISLNLDDKLLPDTSQLKISSENSELKKLTELKERRNKKIKDFVLVGDEEESVEDDRDVHPEQNSIEDFERFEDAPDIAVSIEQMKSNLIMRLIVLFFCFIVSFYIAAANDLSSELLIPLFNKHDQTDVFLFTNTVIGLLAAFTSYNTITIGFSKLLSFKADCDTLPAVSAVTCIITSMAMFANPNMIKAGFVHIYIPVAIGSLLFNTAGKLLIVIRTQRSFNFISGAGEKYAVFNIADEEQALNFTRGTIRDFPSLSSMRKTEFISGFLETSYAPDAADRFGGVFSLVSLLAAVLIAVFAGFMAKSEFGSPSVFVGLSVFGACVSICSGFMIMLAVNLPMAKSSKRHAENQGFILGYDSIDEFADTNSILADAAELFPQGSIKLSAIKVFSDTRIDEAIVEAASLTNQSGSILKNMFYDIIAGKTELLNPVESYIYEDSMGLCGWINNKRILLGNRELMINHSIEGIPSEAREKEYTSNGKAAVYLSISGELSAMFVVELSPVIEVMKALKSLQKYNIYIILRSVDSIVTINRLSEMFGISPEYFKLLPFRTHPEFENMTSYQQKQRASLACSGRFSVLTALLLSCRHIKGTVTAGICLQAISMLLGLIICVVMVISGSYRELTVSMLTLYSTVFTLLLLAMQAVRKT